MDPIPETEDSLLLRTDYSDDVAWKALCAAVRKPVRVLSGEYRAYVTAVSNPAYDGASVDQIIKIASGGHSFAFVADRMAFAIPEHPILVVDLWDEPGRTFRVTPSLVYSVENNLSIANMDFEEFANQVDEAGVFRGFPK